MINFFKKLFNLTPPDLQPDIKVAVLISYKYDKDYLQDCIDNVAELADIWVIKEDVYGDLLKDEGQYRKSMIEEAVSQGANWAIIIDPDERFEKTPSLLSKTSSSITIIKKRKKCSNLIFWSCMNPTATVQMAFGRIKKEWLCFHCVLIMYFRMLNYTHPKTL